MGKGEGAPTCVQKQPSPAQHPPCRSAAPGQGNNSLLSLPLCSLPGLLQSNKWGSNGAGIYLLTLLSPGRTQIHSLQKESIALGCWEKRPCQEEPGELVIGTKIIWGSQEEEGGPLVCSLRRCAAKMVVARTPARERKTEVFSFQVLLMWNF